MLPKVIKFTWELWDRVCLIDKLMTINKKQITSAVNVSFAKLKF